MGEGKHKTRHYNCERVERERFIEQTIGYGDVVDQFFWDKGHRDGPEIHVITSTGIIMIYNALSKKLVTTLIARPAQIQRYYEKEGRAAPPELLALALEHQQKGYNKK